MELLTDNNAILDVDTMDETKRMMLYFSEVVRPYFYIMKETAECGMMVSKCCDSLLKQSLIRNDATLSGGVKRKKPYNDNEGFQIKRRRKSPPTDKMSSSKSSVCPSTADDLFDERAQTSKSNNHPSKSSRKKTPRKVFVDPVYPKHSDTTKDCEGHSSFIPLQDVPTIKTEAVEEDDESIQGEKVASLMPTADAESHTPTTKTAFILEKNYFLTSGKPNVRIGFLKKLCDSICQNIK